MKKKLLVLAAAGALTAATAVPALALENQFNGAFTTFYNLSNYSASGLLADDAATQNYFVSRLRLGYIAKATDTAKLVTKFEFDYNYWGNGSYESARGSGGALGADSVNMETKSLYLDLEHAGVNAKIGMQPYGDSFKGVVFDADMAGILLSHNYEKASIAAGYFRFADSNDELNADGDPTNARIGKNAYDMFSVDAKYSPSKDVSVGAAYYFFNDNHTPGENTLYGDAQVHTVGVNAAGLVGPVALNGFVLGQFGDLNATQDAEGYAFNIGAKLPVAGGTLRSEFLYVSGGDNAFYIPSSDNGYTEGGQFYDSEMTILGRNKYATTIDNAIIYDVNNNSEGVIMGTIGYDYSFSDKLSASANAGFAAVADDVAGARDVARGDSDYLGTEINAETNYSLTSNITLSARAGYVFLGDYFASSLDNPYDLKLVARYVF